MSVISILQNAGLQQFGVHSNAAKADTTKLLSTAESLAGTIDPSGTADDGEDASRSLFESFKDSVELNSRLARSAEESKDSMRGQRIAQIKQRIEQLKEMLRFASPEQAKRMLKELKQISKEFKEAAQELSQAGSALASGGAGSMISAAAGAVGSIISTAPDAVTGSGVLSSADPDSPGAVSQTQIHPSSADQTGPESGTEETGADDPVSGLQGQTGATGQDGSEEEGEDAGWKAELKTAIQSYTDRQEEADKAHRSGRAAALRDEREGLRQIARDIKQLADQLDALAEEDDEETERNLKDIRENLKDGKAALDSPVLQRALESGPGQSGFSASGAPGTQGAAYSLSPSGDTLTASVSEVVV